MPKYFLSVKILENGDLEEFYNGPGEFLVENYILKNKLKGYKQSYYTLDTGILKRLNGEVPDKDKIQVIKQDKETTSK